MICGACGGEVRGYRGTLFGRPIKDWKHRSVPPGTLPHRPILGTPVDQATLDRIHRAATPEKDTAAASEELPPPLVPPRPASSDELESCSSASQILRLLEGNRWELVEAPAFYITAKRVAHIVIKARRHDIGAVASWSRRPDKPWAFEDAYTLVRRRPERVGSTQLKEWIGQREEYCPDCGASSAAHGEECHEEVA